MTEAQAVEAMLEFWEDGWGEIHPDDPIDPAYVPFTLDNEGFDAAISKWVRVTLVNTTRPQATTGGVGTRRYEQRGRIAVQVFADVNRGPIELAALCDDVRTVLEGKAILVATQEIALFEGPTSPMPTNGRWNMALVVVPFLYTAIV